jgi:hypothetical protein
MTVPTGLGFTRGLDAAGQIPGRSFNRVAAAQANDASAVKGETSDPCYCGKCSLVDARWK